MPGLAAALYASALAGTDDKQKSQDRDDRKDKERKDKERKEQERKDQERKDKDRREQEDKDRDHDDGKKGDHKGGGRDDHKDKDKDKDKDRDKDRDDRDRDDHKGDHDEDAKIQPILVCVADEGGDRYTARFTYKNRSDRSITIPIGKDNRFSPAPEGRGQPTAFKPGRPEGDPSRAFAVAFDGRELTWSVKGPDGGREAATASRSSERCPSPPTPCELGFWGPKRFTRTSGAPNVYREDVSVPPSVAPPYVLHVVNDEPDGDDRVSSARIRIDGTTVAEPSDFSKKVPGFEREVRLASTSRLEVTLESQPGSFLTLSFCGRRGDRTPPRVDIVEPGGGAYLFPPVRVRVRYGDESGLALDSLRILVNGQDRTALFSRGAEEAAGTLELASGLREGSNSVEAEIRDVAGNAGVATASFTLDSKPPVVALTSPDDGSYHKTSPVMLTGTVEDADPQVTVECLRAGASAAATVAGSTFTCALPLAEGPNVVRAEARDRLDRRTASDPRTLHLDTIAPGIVFTQPLPGAFVSATTIDVKGEVTDASPIAAVRVEGRQAEVVGSQFTARDVPVGNGPNVTLHAEAEDAAGNVGGAPLPLSVDRESPQVTITRPAPDEHVKGPVIEVEGTVADQSDVMVEVNGVPEDPPPSLRGPRSFHAHVPVTETTTSLVATAIDAAGNPPGRYEVPIRVDSVPPVITIATPTPGLVTKAASVLVSGSVLSASPIVSLTVGGTPVPVAPDGSFQIEFPLPDETTYAIPVEARDAAGNTGTAGTSVVVDRTPPMLQAHVPPAASVVGAVPVTVEGTVVEPHLVGVTVDGQPATVTGIAWQAIVGGLIEGGHTFVVRAEDSAGNASALSHPVTIDLSAPVVTLSSPAPGAVKDATLTVAGTVRDVSLESLAVNGSAVAWTGNPASPTGATFAVPAFPLVDQQDNRIEAVAHDQLQRSGTAEVTVFRDSLPPSLELQTPDSVQRGRTGHALAIADDGAGLGVKRVVFWIDDQEKATLLAPPWEIAFEVPDGSATGTTLKVSAQAWDLLENASPRVSRGVTVVSQGVVVGRVLADETSLPLRDATVRLVAGSTAGVVTVTTDETGGYSLPADAAAARIEVESAGRLSVQRELGVEASVGSVPVDARLVTLAPAKVVDPTGGSVALDGPAPVTITIPAGALAADTDVRLTRLTSQGLPGLLPLGWSALVGFDLRADAALQGPLPVSAGGLPDGLAHLVQYRPSVRSWVMLDPGLAPAAGALSFTLPGAGSYALAVTDAGDPPVAVPAVGDPLTGVAMAVIPATATSAGVVDPPVLPPSGGSATGTLTLTSPAALPSGTVVQAEVTEMFTLASGDVASEEKRDHDIVLYRTPPASSAACQPSEPGAFALCASFPITPSRSFETTDLASGKVHLDILAGREGVRGKVGGSDAVRVESTGGEASVIVPAQALPRNTAIAIETQALSGFLPSTGVVPLAELVLDLSGQKLALGAELEVASPGVPTDAVLVVARVQRIDGIPRLAVVSLASLVTAPGGDRLMTVPYAGLPGVLEGGRYVFLRLAGPVGFVNGRTLQGTVGVRSLVESAGLPFIGLAAADGSYVIAVSPGDVTLEARVPQTSLRGTSGPLVVEAAPAAPTAKDIALQGTLSVASVDPPNGTLDLPVTQQLEITSPGAIRPETLTADGVRLFRVDGATLVPVTLRLQLSGSGKKLAVIPTTRLAFESTYKLESSGLVDVFGALVSVPETSFTTRKEVPPASHPDRLFFSFPDARGLVTVSGPGKADAPPDGTFEAGTEILIINASNGVVLTLKAGNQNEVAPFEFPATINDRLMITVTDTFGNTTSFERSQFTNPDTGETAVGPGGGVVEGPGGVELRIPTGAVDQGVVFKIAGLTPAELEAELGDDKAPDIPDAHLGSALRIEAPSKPTFKKEVDLVFPLPAEALAAAQAQGKTADDVFFYVHRRITDPRGAVLFQALDWGQLECPGGAASCPEEEKKVVTSSFPFPGLITSTGVLAVSSVGAVAVAGVALAHAYLMWTFNALLPGQPTSGVVTGQVLRPEFPEGATVPVYKAVPGVPVWGKDASGLDLVLTPQPGAPPQTVAETDGDGRFTFFDNRFTTGSLEVKTSVDGVEYRATAYAVQLTDTKALANPAIAALARSLKAQQVATVDITVAPKVPPPPPPAVDVKVMRVVNGAREATDGVVVANTPLLIGFKHTSNLAIASAEVNGRGLQIVPDNFAGTAAGSPLAMDNLGLDVDAPDGTYTPKTAGRYNVKVVARPVIGDITRTESFDATFLVVEGNEENSAIREGEPPGVITARTLPLNGKTEVPVEVLPQVVFTEPVVNVPAGIFLQEIDAAGSVVETVPVGLVGVTPAGQILQVVGPTDTVVSVTLKPLRGLKFGTTYQLRVSAAIMDRDTAPNALSPEHTSGFTTFGPKALGATEEEFVSPGLVVLGGYAYVLETNYPGGVAAGAQNGFVRTFDIFTNPALPVEVAAKEFVAFPPRDIAGEGHTIAVVTSSRTFYRLAGSDLVPSRELVSTPGNLLLYDVADGAPKWIGAASVATSLLDGFANRVVMDSGRAYVAMARKGIQVVDIAAAKAAFENETSFEVSKQMSTPGVGFGLGAVKTIPVLDPERPFTAALMDLKVKDLPWLGEPKRVVLGTGSSRGLGLVVGDPNRLQELWRGAVQKTDSVLDWGTALAPAVIEGQQLVLLGGYGKVDGGEAAGVVAIVDLTPMGVRPPPGDPDPVPKVVRFIKLDHTVGDIWVFGTTAIVSGGQGAVGPDGKSGVASFIDLNNPAEARVIGTLSGVGSRLAFNENAVILLSTDRLFLAGAPTELGGIQTAALRPWSPCGSLRAIPTPSPFSVSLLNWSMQVVVTPDDGLSLENVKLGDRQMAESMRVPYFIVTTSTTPDIGARCELKPDAVGVCDLANPAARSRLVSLRRPLDSLASRDQRFSIEATYAIDRLDGNPEDPLTPDVPDTCVLVTQRHEFAKETSGWVVRPHENPAFPLGIVDPSGDPCETSGKFTCARFKPKVEYRFSSDRVSLRRVSIPSRLHFRALEPPPSRVAGSNAVVLFHDCALFGLPGFVGTAPSECTFGATPGSILPLHVVAAYDDENPLSRETTVKVIEGGKAFNATDSGGRVRSIDNIHQSSLSVVDEPDLNPGCPECVHMHWRWDKLLKPETFGVNLNVHPRFDNNEGEPIIFPGSTQTVHIAVVQGRASEDDPLAYESLANGESLLPEANASPVTWYVGESTQLHDRFLEHGGFFSSSGVLPQISLVVASDATQARIPVTVRIKNAASHPIRWMVTLENKDGTERESRFGLTEGNEPIVLTFSVSQPGEVQFKAGAVDTVNHQAARAAASTVVP